MGSGGNPPRATLTPSAVLLAVRVFDRTNRGFLSAGDLELILQNGGTRMSRAGVRALVSLALGSASYNRAAKLHCSALAGFLRPAAAQDVGGMEDVVDGGADGEEEGAP